MGFWDKCHYYLYMSYWNVPTALKFSFDHKELNLCNFCSIKEQKYALHRTIGLMTGINVQAEEDE